MVGIVALPLAIAFGVIVYGIIQQYGLDGLQLATLMAGGILLVLGFARLGGAIKFIPFPVMTGFTGGIALIIFWGEVKDFLRLPMGEVPAASSKVAAVFPQRGGG